MQQALSHDRDDLEHAFSSLLRVSRELDVSYQCLETGMARLQDELARSRSARVAELAEQQRLLERLASLMAMLPGGVLLIDSNLRVRDANPEALRLLGEPLLGAIWPEVQARISSDGKSVRQPRQLSFHSRTLSQHNETLVLVTDNSERHALEVELQREQRLRALGEMAARLAHQIRTPLASAMLFLSQLRRGDLAEQRRNHICDRLREQMGHMEGLIESMLGFVRGDPPQRELIHVQDLLADLERSVRGALERSAARLTITPVDRSLCLWGAREALVAALGNLVVNAIEAGGDDVHIEIWAGAASRERLLLRVSDNGPGIKDDNLQRIFDPFFTTRESGTGLGLAIVARTAESHGGSVRVDNRVQGGSEFTLELPMAAEAQQS